jgi:hypothetical protein
VPRGLACAEADARFVFAVRASCRGSDFMKRSLIFECLETKALLGTFAMLTPQLAHGLQPALQTQPPIPPEPDPGPLPPSDPPIILPPLPPS